MTTWQLIIALAIGMMAILVASWLSIRLSGTKISFKEYLSPLWKWRKAK